MRRVTIKGMRGHLVRFLLTALAVTLGVAFVAGSFVLRDSMNNTLDDLLSSAAKGVDVSVRGQHAGTGDGGRREPLAIDLVDRLATVDGVASARPDLQGDAMIVGKDGLVVRNGGAPTLGFAYQADDVAFTLVDGRPPTGPGEIVVERATLEKAGLAVGDSTRALIGNDAREVRITGEVTFGSLFGATAILLDKATAQAAFAPDGKLGTISLTATAGISQEQLRSRVAAVLPAGAEAVTGDTLRDDARAEVQQVFNVFTTFLLVFAGVALFVGAFIIVNTFSIVLAQRTRELALLRAAGPLAARSGAWCWPSPHSSAWWAARWGSASGSPSPPA
jgi:putative ABC transport system permease protein